MLIPEIQRNIKQLTLLAKLYPTIQSVCTEIINLRAILDLPKGTEHFLSDLHGEYEAFTHILNNCSGVIREKVDELYTASLSEQERAQLCSLIYYPKEKLAQLKKECTDINRLYETTLYQLLAVCKRISGKYTRSKVRKAMPPDYSYILDELLHADYGETNQSVYYSKIMESILALHNADDFIIALASLVKRLAVDRLHIVGDIFDRGARPDLIMDQLEKHHAVDIQWGNHDILWMGAAAGNDACIATVVCNCVSYNNLEVLEQGYGINLRPLALFAQKAYGASPFFTVKSNGSSVAKHDTDLACKMRKAISVIMLKLEGQLIRRHPAYEMDDRLLLEKLDMVSGTVCINGSSYPLNDCDLPTLCAEDPYRLSGEEQALVEGLQTSFLHSEKLRRHAAFLYSHGGMYKIFNQNLLFHGCVPMNEDGSFAEVLLDGKAYSGRALLDYAQEAAHRAFFDTGKDRAAAGDHMYYLWCGRLSPIFGRDRMTTFERLFVADQSTWTEQKNSYYRHVQTEQGCMQILAEFGLIREFSHIINGHVPVKAGKGENPVKGDGKLIVIDGGFCKAYQSTTGIAGYTLIYNSYGLRLSAHHPFESIQKAVEENIDIHSSTDVFETLVQRMKVLDTDIGQEISEQIYDLSLLLDAYRGGIIKQPGTGK